jgi:hypothetical protein
MCVCLTPNLKIRPNIGGLWMCEDNVKVN